MVIGFTLALVAILVIGIWFFIELKRFKHKIWAILVIGLIVFSYVSFSATLKNQDINYATLSGLTKAGKIYFLWLGSVIKNVKTITLNVIKMDWTSSNNEINSSIS
jgi:uncharacterized membrane protein